MSEASQTKLTYTMINEDVLEPLKTPRLLYFAAVAMLACGILWAGISWIYQVKTGMGVTGLSIPVGWAFYITNFVFWVGIGHAGTLISAILHLVRSRWRTAISRSAEAMTVFAVVTAALFPLVHLGRVWVFYYIIPYPSQRQLWPDFVSPLVWDVCAVGTYLIVSTIFWLVGLIPDVAAARDRCAESLGADHPRTKLYSKMALGWTGSSRQWHHFGRAYLFFAALATPLVISVHSVVSWDFAMAQLPGWHTTIFAPYFVAGAIHSGLAMVLTLVIPMRRLLRLDKLITMEHFNAMAKTMVVTALIVGYTYIIEPFIAWYSHDIFEQQFSVYRATGWFAVFYWALSVLNVLAPLTFLFRAARKSIIWLFMVGLLVNVGMWLERWVIIAGSLSHDFLPHNWHPYAPTWVEISITVGSFTFFLFWFFGFSRLFPTVAASDVKELSAGLLYKPESHLKKKPEKAKKLKNAGGGVLAVFSSHEGLLETLRSVRNANFERVEAFSPFRLDEASLILGRTTNPVRRWTLTGALCGCIGGFWLAIGSAWVNALTVGGKFSPWAYIPYCIVGFEGLILIGTLANLSGMLFHARLGRSRLPAGYDRRFTQDKFGLFVDCWPQQIDEVKTLMSLAHAEEINVIG
jgi:Ni/Fe-hydrogenase subunit HybB-like protein